MKRSSLRSLCLPIVVAHALVAGAAAQQPPAGDVISVELRLATRTLELGEAVSAQLICTNTGMPDLPEITAPDGLDLRITNPAPSQFSQTSYINGRVSKKTTFTFAMRLVALKEGTHTLPPIEVAAGGRTYHTDPVRIVVRKTDTASVPKGDGYLFVEIAVDRTSVYVTESYVATLVFGIRKVEIGGRQYELDLLRNVLDVRRSQLSVFAGGNATRSERELPDSKGIKHSYEIYRVVKELRAEQVGETPVGPVFLRARYPTALRRGFFGGIEVSQARTETARANAIVVTVKAPPVKDRPEHFSGAVGKYAMHVSAKPTRMQQGQPLTLTIAIEGRPLAGVAGPDLARQPELASRFDYVKDELVGDVEGGAKVFRRAVFPRQEGGQTIPAILWSYFDPQTEQYITITSEPVNILVDPPTPGSNAETFNDQQDIPDPAPITLTVLAGGISPNYIDPDVVLASQALTLNAPWGLGALALPPIVWLVVTLAAQHRTRLRADAGYARRRRARRQAMSAVRRSLVGGNGSAQWAGLVRAMAGYLGDHFNLPPGELTPADVRSLLSSSHLDASTVQEIERFFEACEARRYMPGAPDDQSPEKAAAGVRRWVRKIEKST